MVLSIRTIARLTTLVIVASGNFDGASAQIPVTGKPPITVGPVSSAVKASANEPSAPVAPEVITRDANGRATVRAVRLTERIVVDGRLDEPPYRTTKVITGFLQGLPDNGAPASQKTEAWVFFDREAIYVSARCWDSTPESEWVMDELRRDKTAGGDNFGVLFDTFHDRRTSLMFYANPRGGWTDAEITNERNANYDFNAVWTVRTGRFEGGWTIEMRFPFKSFRYPARTSQVWGFNLRRNIRGRDEWSFLNPIPVSMGKMGLFAASYAGNLVGLEVPPDSRVLDIKPYAITRVTTDAAALPPLDHAVSGDVGLDFKYSIAQYLTLDATVNTDIAQVEVDEQQVNLTRFNLLFPEKRDFFLEGRGLFDFAPPTSGGPSNGEAPQLFFSRRIGLNGGRVVPIVAGGRLRGKVGRVALGILHVRTGAELLSRTVPTDFSVVRLKHDVLRRSNVGMIFTNRSASAVVPGSTNQVFGIDANFALLENIYLNGFYAASRTGGALAGASDSYQARFDYTADRYGFAAEHLFIGQAFNPEVGFVPRPNQRRTYLAGRFSPRLRSSPVVRKLSWTVDADYRVNPAGQVESRDFSLAFDAEFHNTERLTIEAAHRYDLLVQPFLVAPGVTVAVGGYDMPSFRSAYAFGNHRRLAGSLSIERRGFYGGSQSSLGFSSGRLELNHLLSFEPSVLMTWVELPHASFTANVYRTRANVTFSPTMFISALVQYNSTTRTAGTNVRYAWEYRRGSELFVAYTDEQNMSGSRVSSRLLSRAVAVKITRLVRF